MHDEVGEIGAEKVSPSKAEQTAWKEAKKKIEELETKMTEQFEDAPTEREHDNPMLKAPVKPTQEEWNKHQTTHTPFAAWCPHCLAARNVRRNHPTQGRKGRLVPDTETGEGPTKVSLDYMYLHDRVGRYKETQHNPPYLVIVEHTYGRCWTYQVPNKEVKGEAHWAPKRILQDLENK